MLMQQALADGFYLLKMGQFSPKSGRETAAASNFSGKLSISSLPLGEVGIMTLFDLAKNNLKQNTKHYLLYFYPMVFSIVIYFTFVSLQYNKQIHESATVLGKVEPAFMAASVLLFLFSAIFIWY